MNERQKMAFDFARDTTKQLITLSTAIIAVTVTFWDKLFTVKDSFSRNLAVFSWVAFLISVIFGIWTLLALTGTLESLDKENSASIRSRNITLPSFLQITAFLLGLALTVWFGTRAT